MSWRDPAGDYVADGLYYYGKRQARTLDLLRTGLGYCQSRPGVDLCDVLRFERCRRCILRIVHLSRSSDLPDRASAQRFSLVGREPGNRSIISQLDRSSFLRIFPSATAVGINNWNYGWNHLWSLLASSTAALGSTQPYPCFCPKIADLVSLGTVSFITDVCVFEFSRPSLQLRGTL
jgi:hypothetical protein